MKAVSYEAAFNVVDLKFVRSVVVDMPVDDYFDE